VSAVVSEPISGKSEAPWVAGLRAAKANVIPGLILQLVMLAVVLGYYYYPPTKVWLDAMGRVKDEWGYVYSAGAAVIAGAFLPELLRIVVFQKGRLQMANAVNLIYTIPFWGIMAITVDVLYRVQAIWFGTAVTFAVVVKKVLFDQFVFSPWFSGPMSVWFYDFKNNGRQVTRPREFFTWRHYREKVLPVMFATWGVWIPVVSLLYSLPKLLQIPVYILALTLWVMIFTWMNEKRADESLRRS
jgi:hypothetical protein